MKKLEDYLYYHEPGPPDIKIYHGDCAEIMPLLAICKYCGKPKENGDYKFHLCCGDCSHQNIELMLTDPPYGVDLGDHDGGGEKRPGFLVKQHYDSYEDSYENFKKIVPSTIELGLKLSNRAIVFMNSSNMWDLPRPDIVGGIFVSAGVGRNKWGFTNVVHALMYGSAYALNKGSKPTMFQGNDAAEKNGHPTPKPVRWIKRMIDLGSGEGHIVLDPFLGSGTTLVACKELKRNGIGVEISEKYCAIAKKRLQNTQVPFL